MERKTIVESGRVGVIFAENKSVTILQSRHFKGFLLPTAQGGNVNIRENLIDSFYNSSRL